MKRALNIPNMNSASTEARRNSKCMLKPGRMSSKVTDASCKIYGDNVPEKPAVYKWVTCVKYGQDNTEDETHWQTTHINLSAKKKKQCLVYALIEEDR